MRSKKRSSSGVDGLPFQLGSPGTMVSGTRQHEQQIGQAIHIRQQLGIHAIDTERDDRTLGTAADRAGEMQQGASLGSTRQDEAPQRRQFGVDPVDPVLETLDVFMSHRRLADAIGDFVSWISERGADGEQVALQALQHLREVGGEFRMHPDDPETRVQLVDVSVRRHTWIVLGHASSAEQRGAAGVARACVDLHGGQYT